MEVEFRDVVISFSEVNTPEEAYDKLCNLLAGADPNVCWATKGYATWDEQNGMSPARGTFELFPENRGTAVGRHDE